MTEAGGTVPRRTMFGRTRSQRHFSRDAAFRKTNNEVMIGSRLSGPEPTIKETKGVWPKGSMKTFICGRCGMSYAHFASLARHRHKCEGTLVLTCSFCQRTFHRKDKLREHYLNKHNYIDTDLGAPGYTLNTELDSDPSSSFTKFL